MAEIFRPVYTATDPKTGRKVKRKSRRWWIRFYTPDGVRHKVKGYLDRKATETLAAELVKRGERLAGGPAPPLGAHRTTPPRPHAAHHPRHPPPAGHTPRPPPQTTRRGLAPPRRCAVAARRGPHPA